MSASEGQARERPQSHKINTNSVLLLVLIRISFRVRVRGRVRGRVTKLVYQIGFTTPF